MPFVIRAAAIAVVALTLAACASHGGGHLPEDEALYLFHRQMAALPQVENSICPEVPTVHHHDYGDAGVVMATVNGKPIGRRFITVNRWVYPPGPLRDFVLAHECAHVRLGHEPFGEALLARQGDPLEARISTALGSQGRRWELEADLWACRTLLTHGDRGAILAAIALFKKEGMAQRRRSHSHPAPEERARQLETCLARY